MKPALIVFAKHPVPGKVKTRLAQHCGDKTAAEIATVLLTETIKLTAQYWSGPRLLYCWPNQQLELFSRLANDYGLVLKAQPPGSLGDKMYTVLKTEISQHGAAAIIGADVPHCSGTILNKAYQLLTEKKSVIGPASDGGYYFIGLHKPAEKLFADIDWGSKHVLADTRKRADELGIQFYDLQMLQDIDHWQDLVAAADQLPGLKKFVT
jgi:rSAM/selenodomain-associated transferase 1